MQPVFWFLWSQGSVIKSHIHTAILLGKDYLCLEPRDNGAIDHYAFSFYTDGAEIWKMVKIKQA